MKAVIQRVARASVEIDRREKRAIGRGLLILLGAARGDTEKDAEWLARKIAAMRIFSDEKGKMNRSVLDIDGDALIVSQFTLLAAARKGNRPSFDAAAPPEHAVPLYRHFVDSLETRLGKAAATGEFGAGMQVESVNDGPVTILLDSRVRE